MSTASKRAVFLNMLLAIVVIMVVATLFNAPLLHEPSWATITDMHVSWSWRRGVVDLSMQLDKRRKCRRVLLTTIWNSADGDDVVPGGSALKTDLTSKMQEAEIGISTIFDELRPERMPRQGQYVLTIQALCEPETQHPTTEIISAVGRAIVIVGPDRHTPPTLPQAPTKTPS